LERNEKHFGQATNTPFAQEALVQTFGYRGVNKQSRELLQLGIIPNILNQDNEYVDKAIKKLSMGQLIEVEKEINFEEYKSALHKWNEKTTTSPSDRNLGHYKILLKINVYEDEFNKINIGEKILRLLFNISSISIRLGRPLERWKNITTCMIGKSSRSSKTR
jgi:hypothetical protein